MCGKMLESQPIDFVTVLEALKADGFFSGEDGKAYLLKLAQMVPSISNVGNYARIIREKADVRRLIQAAREIAEDAMDPSVEPAMLLDSAEQKIYDIRQDRQQGGLMPISEVLASNFEMFNKLASSERSDYVGIPSGHLGARCGDHRPQPLGSDYRRRTPRYGKNQLCAQRRTQCSGAAEPYGGGVFAGDVPGAAGQPPAFGGGPGVEQEAAGGQPDRGRVGTHCGSRRCAAQCTDLS